jgi:hypothetical protein
MDIHSQAFFRLPMEITNAIARLKLTHKRKEAKGGTEYPKSKGIVPSSENNSDRGEELP